VSKSKPVEAFAIIKGAANWRMFSIFDEDPISGVSLDHPNNVHNMNRNLPASYPSRYPAKRTCASLNEKYPGAYYGVCKVV
jgi:hypothetical protein